MVATGPRHHAIHQVTGMEWVLVGNGLSTKNKPLSGTEEMEEETYLNLLRQIADTKSFYFSPTGYDLTNSVQRNDINSLKTAGIDINTTTTTSNNTTAQVKYSWHHADDRFFWNKSACKELMSAGIHEYITPMINGFVGSGDVKEFDCTLLLVTRRACTRQGTRFNMRGADAEGNVANYAETEQLLLFADSKVASYIQTRGSIPLMWDQPVTLKYTPKVSVSNNTRASYSAFQRHIQSQIERYDSVTAVNLIDQKGDQKTLGSLYREYADRLREKNFSLVWFDFHHECRKMKWHNLSKLQHQVQPALDQYGYYLQKAPHNTNNTTSPSTIEESVCVPTRTQHGVVRTNCMDNLDRTNVVQSLFARQAALSSIPGAIEKTRNSGCSVLTSPFAGFEKVFNHLWADNADAVSFLYSGTGALKTDFTRTGKRTIQGAIQDGINSVMRYIYNNFVDGRNQDAWDLFVGRYLPERLRDDKEAGDGKYKASGILVPIKAHNSDMTPTGFLLRVVTFFTGLSISLAYAATLAGVSPQSRLTYGISGAVVVFAGLGYMAMGKGWKQGVKFVSKPNFVPAIPVYNTKDSKDTTHETTAQSIGNVTSPVTITTMSSIESGVQRSDSPQTTIKSRND